MWLHFFNVWGKFNSMSCLPKTSTEKAFNTKKNPLWTFYHGADFWFLYDFHLHWFLIRLAAGFTSKGQSLLNNIQLFTVNVKWVQIETSILTSYKYFFNATMFILATLKRLCWVKITYILWAVAVTSLFFHWFLSESSMA
jgi:hypothetical protein